MGSEKDTGRTLLRMDWTLGPHTAPPLLSPMSAALVVMAGVIFLLKLVAVVVLKMEPLVAVLVAVVGMLLGVMGLLK